MKRIAIAAVAALGLGLGALPAQAQPAGGNACQFPTTPPPPSGDAGAFATYAWQMFIALNWTPQVGDRGVPDCTKPLGGSTSGTVWQTYKTVDEIFLPNAQNPGPWNSSLTATLFKQTAKASTAVQTSAMGTVMQPVGGWLIDQAGNPTYYEIAANRVSYDYIVANGFYNANTVNAARNIAFPEGATEIKASWRILTALDDTSRYLTLAATVETFDANGKPNGTKAATLGLVGLHIIVKAKGYPQWIWSTFEQVDNVTPAPNGKASYSDPNAKPSDVNQSPCQVGVLPCTPKPGKTFQTPDPLTRVTAIPSAVAAINQQIQAQYGSTFVKYYELVATQHPADPGDPGNPLGTPTPNLLANVTMESYLQPTSSCMACHSTAVSGPSRYKSDFSFLFIHAQAPKSGH
ncbi:hypothetical protein [Nitrospirillum sp. BR 11828]|uniref:hypothetical protein n=1 Tax=Nitrospirillum sp. BR 11828 TaxID=3104325 RepID=UPI002AC9F54D|nr:hypothetical protein [Nitrospirillum sp. BR 11828]MDZ5646028.1 hypothetical protein [Nitrospirillum sp. BR 11828]